MKACRQTYWLNSLPKAAQQIRKKINKIKAKETEKAKTEWQEEIIKDLQEILVNALRHHVQNPPGWKVGSQRKFVTKAAAKSGGRGGENGCYLVKIENEIENCAVVFNLPFKVRSSGQTSFVCCCCCYAQWMQNDIPARCALAQGWEGAQREAAREVQAGVCARWDVRKVIATSDGHVKRSWATSSTQFVTDGKLCLG